MIFLDRLLSVLTGRQNVSERVELTRLSANLRSGFFEDYHGNLRVLKLATHEVEGEVSMMLALRILWRLVPDALFTQGNPDYEELAFAMIEKEITAVPSEMTIQMLATIYRRLRSARTSGRAYTTSLDLETSTHRALLDGQGGACLVCRYKFYDVSADSLHETDLSYFEEEYRPFEGEVFLEQYFRRPTLDHVIPYFLGGDGPENWQILCETCNAGKGASLSWLNRKGWMPATSLSEVLNLTPALRYSALSSANMRVENDRLAPGKSIRLFKKDTARLLYLDNLSVRFG